MPCFMRHQISLLMLDGSLVCTFSYHHHQGRPQQCHCDNLFSPLTLNRSRDDSAHPSSSGHLVINLALSTHLSLLNLSPNSFNMPGFDFSNHNRNAALHARGVPLPKATSTGTTIVGCIFDGGVVIAADTRATSGPIVADKVSLSSLSFPTYAMPPFTDLV